ncbi:MAG: hypothetical protein ACT4QF_05410 [Sporichthyaceae bacterium]
MPRLLLEGRSITELLARVRAEHGPDVRIVSADRVRTGGVGGFFARESYALTVELDGPVEASADSAVDRALDGALAPSAAVAQRAERSSVDPQAPGTLLDLAAAIDAAEAAERGVVLGTAPMHATAAAPAAPAVSTATATAAPSGPAPSGPALSGPALSGPALSGPAPSGPAPSGPALSTSGSGFAEILARLAALEGPAPVAVPDPEPTAGPGALALDAAGWDRLRGLLSELCGYDLAAETGALVLVLAPPAATTPPAPPLPAAQPAAAPTQAPPAQAAEPFLPRQGRHRRGVVAEFASTN